MALSYGYVRLGRFPRCQLISAPINPTVITMLQPNCIVHLADGAVVYTEGGVVSDIDRLAGRLVQESDNVLNGSHVGTYVVDGQNGGYEVAQSDVTEVQRL